MDLYQRMSDRSMAKLYWIARHCGDFATAKDILRELKQRTELDAERPECSKAAASMGSRTARRLRAARAALADSRCTSHYVCTASEQIRHEQQPRRL